MVPQVLLVPEDPRSADPQFSNTLLKALCPVVRWPVRANPWLNFNPGFFITFFKSPFRIIFSV